MLFAKDTRVYLASRSPRRRELLRQIGVPHGVRAADVDESVEGLAKARPHFAAIVGTIGEGERLEARTIVTLEQIGKHVSHRMIAKVAG